MDNTLQYGEIDLSNPVSTLVIHPDDRSTDFLRPIYRDITNSVIVTGGKSHEEILNLIENHDRVIMLGHGSTKGLFGINFNRALVIDGTCVEALSKKKDNVYIWCNADVFVEWYNLKGFYSGMFISEVGEADYCNVITDQEQVSISNKLFAIIVGNYINKPSTELHSLVKETYGALTKDNKVAKYNWDRLKVVA